MAEALSTPRVVRFSAFELDLRTSELRKAGERVSLQEQPLQVLTMLLERPGDLITREELRWRLWPADTFVDFEQGLNAAVKRLRHALGDSADTPLLIETLKRRGYRFIGPVAGDSTAGSGQPVISEGFAEGSRHAARRLDSRAFWLGGVGLSGIALMAALSLLGHESAPLPRIVPLTSLDGQEWDPALSPDGRQVAFCWDGGEGRPGLYVKHVDGGDPVRLDLGPVPVPGRVPASEGIFSPAWSPDGQEIAFLRHLPDTRQHEIVVVALSGGAQRVVGTTTSEEHGLAWSPDGRFLAIVDRPTAEEPDSIFLLDMLEGHRRRLTAPPATAVLRGDRLPAFSPDGRSLAFVRDNSALPRADVYLQPLPDGDLRALAFNEVSIAGVAWTPDSSAIIYSAGGWGQVRRLKALRPSGGPASTLAFGEDATGVTISRSANRLAYARSLMDTNLWRVDGPTASARSTPVRLIQSTEQDMMPDVSPDGTRIVFTSTRSGRLALWTCASDGTRCSELRTDVHPAANGKWSPDGTRIVFVGGELGAGGVDVYVLEVATGFTRRLTDHPAVDRLPSWSRDGQSIYFSSDRDGTYRVWRVPAAGGAATPLTTRGTSSWEAADSRWLYYHDLPLASGIWRIPVEGGQEHPVLQDQIATPSWTVWRNHLVLIRVGGPGSPVIETLDLESGRRTKLASVGPVAAGIAVSPDGRWVLYSQVDDSRSDVVLVDGPVPMRRSLTDLMFPPAWRRTAERVKAALLPR